ncbi:MAG: glycoside hydrolase family 5 protein [Aristaeellaceae bacterium]
MSEFTYLKGINLGGWLSQYMPGTDLKKHYASFITERDIDQIASWGADHVRLPFESGVLEDESLHYMAECIRWCNSRGMGVILDLHYVQGMTYDPNRKFNTLFLPENTGRMMAVWQKVARHFAACDDGVRYELLNEITDGTGYLWNRLYPKVLAAIREVDPHRVVYVGSNKMNDVQQLSSLALVDDPHVIYNFHFYEPHPFTHQRAGFDQDMSVYDHAYPYPCRWDGLYEYMQAHPGYARRYPYLVFQQNDLAQMRDNLAPASDFMTYTGAPLYCGEFGVIGLAEEKDAAAWIADCVSELRARNIGYACWCYKAMDFGLVDADSRLIRPSLIQPLFG